MSFLLQDTIKFILSELVFRQKQIWKHEVNMDLHKSTVHILVLQRIGDLRLHSLALLPRRRS